MAIPGSQVGNAPLGNAPLRLRLGFVLHQLVIAGSDSPDGFKVSLFPR
jgi:hypothetical protein